MSGVVPVFCEVTRISSYWDERRPDSRADFCPHKEHLYNQRSEFAALRYRQASQPSSTPAEIQNMPRFCLTESSKLQSFTLLLEHRLNSLIIPLPHPCSVLLLNKTSISIAQKTHHTLAGIQLSHNNIEWGEGGG